VTRRAGGSSSTSTPVCCGGIATSLSPREPRRALDPQRLAVRAGHGPTLLRICQPTRTVNRLQAPT
jgi:hypothetical protein